MNQSATSHFYGRGKRTHNAANNGHQSHGKAPQYQAVSAARGAIQGHQVAAAVAAQSHAVSSVGGDGGAPAFNNKSCELADPCVRNIKQARSQRKIFVGGIASTTTKQKMMAHFGQYGRIEDCIIMVDRDHKPRGFGFVTFSDINAIDRVLEVEDHCIEGKVVECKKAVPKEASSAQTAADKKQRRITKATQLAPEFSSPLKVDPLVKQAIIPSNGISFDSGGGSNQEEVKKMQQLMTPEVTIGAVQPHESKESPQAHQAAQGHVPDSLDSGEEAVKQTVAADLLTELTHVEKGSSSAVPLQNATSTRIVEELKRDGVAHQQTAAATNVSSSEIEDGDEFEPQKDANYKDNQDYIDEKVAKFAGKLLIDQEGDVERGGHSRRESDRALGKWATELGYHATNGEGGEEEESKSSEQPAKSEQPQQPDHQTSYADQISQMVQIADDRKQERIEKRAVMFVDSIQHELPCREAPSSEQILYDQDELDTLQILGTQSRTSGDEIDAQLRKVFVGGLPHNLQLSSFKLYFGNFGEIEDCVILQDKRTNKPRGFGFVTYSDIRSVNLVLKLKQKHVIQNKWVDVKSAVPIQQMKEVMEAQQCRQNSRGSKGRMHQGPQHGPAQTYAQPYGVPYYSPPHLVPEISAPMMSPHGTSPHDPSYMMYHPSLMMQQPHPMHHHPQTMYGPYPPYYAGYPQRPPMVYQKVPPPLFPDHKPPVPDADLLARQKYHQYMHEAATRWYKTQELYRQNHDASSGNSDSRSDADSRNPKTRRMRPSRLPPPIPPPPFFLEEMVYEQMMMSPDVSQNSASMHEIQIEHHLQSLMNVYQPGSGPPVDWYPPSMRPHAGSEVSMPSIVSHHEQHQQQQQPIHEPSSSEEAPGEREKSEYDEPENNNDEASFEQFANQVNSQHGSGEVMAVKKRISSGRVEASVEKRNSSGRIGASDENTVGQEDDQEEQDDQEEVDDQNDQNDQADQVDQVDQADQEEQEDEQVEETQTSLNSTTTTEENKSASLNRFNQSIKDNQQLRYQGQDNFDPNGKVDWGSNEMGGFLTQQQE